MKAGDIIFVQGDSFISKAIQYFDKGQFSHVAIAVSDTHIIEAQYMTDVCYREFPYHNNCVILDLGLDLKQREAVAQLSFGLIGKRYDYFQLVWYVLRRVFHLKGRNPLNNPNNLICSELVYTVLEHTAILKELGIKSPHGIDSTPNELYDLIKYLAVSKEDLR